MQYDERTALEKIFSSDSRFRSKDELNEKENLKKKHTKAPLTVIGSSIGGRNHATVLHSCKAVADTMDIDKQFKAQIEEIERIVLGKN